MRAFRAVPCHFVSTRACARHQYGNVDGSSAFVGDSTSEGVPSAVPAGRAAAAAIQLAKLSHGLPAVLAADLNRHAPTSGHQLITVEADAAESFFDNAIQSLTLASEAVVPLNSGSSARFIVFRDAMGGNEVANIVGKPR